MRGKGSTRKAKTENRKRKAKTMKRKNKKMAANAEGVNEPVRDWLLREHPDEKTMIGSFSKTVTFDEVARRMRAGENFYDICDCGESVQREYCFGRMAELFGTNYEYWYRTWLEGKPPKCLKPREPKRMIGNCILITRITK